MAAVAGAPAGKVVSRLAFVAVTVIAGVESSRKELPMTTTKPAAMTKRINNPAAAINNHVPLPIPFLVVLGAGIATVVDVGFETAVVATAAPAALLVLGGGTAAAGIPSAGTCMSTTVILSLPPA